MNYLLLDNLEKFRTIQSFRRHARPYLSNIFRLYVNGFWNLSLAKQNLQRHATTYFKRIDPTFFSSPFLEVPFVGSRPVATSDRASFAFPPIRGQGERGDGWSTRERKNNCIRSYKSGWPNQAPGCSRDRVDLGRISQRTRCSQGSSCCTAAGSWSATSFNK